MTYDIVVNKRWNHCIPVGSSSGNFSEKMDFLKVKRLFEPWNANEGESRPFDKERWDINSTWRISFYTQITSGNLSPSIHLARRKRSLGHTFGSHLWWKRIWVNRVLSSDWNYCTTKVTMWNFWGLCEEIWEVDFPDKWLSFRMSIVHLGKNLFTPS